VSSRVLIVIPARYQSSRFPGKPLVPIAGVTLIERVYRRCVAVDSEVQVVVATDDQRIRDHVLKFGGEVVMTRSDHPSGTDRVAEAARKSRAPIIINVQGDEPLLDPRSIRRLIAAMAADHSISMATLCHEVKQPRDYLDPGVVKVTMNRLGNALYFSRSPIPFFRDTGEIRAKLRQCWRHIGIYGYRRDFLFKYVRWPQSGLEKAEKLEQLRALENGVNIRVLKTSYEAIGVDVPADVRKVERLLKRENDL
jgi:3-deoxy-manno-octulosonate cytidylyltransferase (CMP-KDO synthetase)